MTDLLSRNGATSHFFILSSKNTRQIKPDNAKFKALKIKNGVTRMKSVGLVGWRGMVGSVLMQRMRDENDFAKIKPTFFTTSQGGSPAPSYV